MFDGWGYVHLFDAKTMAGLDQYFIPESQDEDYADGFGDLSVHEVATDPDEDLAYISYYAGGLRVLKYDDDDLTEVGAYIDPDGNNFWGVEVHKHPNGQKIRARLRPRLRRLDLPVHRRLIGRSHHERLSELSSGCRWRARRRPSAAVAVGWSRW